MPRIHPELILPVGTQIVTAVEVQSRGDATPRPAGAVGIVIEVPGQKEYARLHAELQHAYESSALPEAPTG